MNQIARIPTNAAAAYNAQQINLIRRTVAKDCDNDEFDLFVNACRRLDLDPLRKQIYCFVYNKDKPDKRKMTIVTGIDGFRTIAERTGNYRPDEEEPDFEYDPAEKGPNNPAGLVKATVRVHKFSHGSWHKVTASAHWMEYAPLKEEWAYSEESGRKQPNGVFKLDQTGNWPKMPRLMLAKVAEALALRKAWPDAFSSVYAQEEIDRSQILDEMTPSEAADAGAAEKRMEKIGGANAILIQWDANGPLVPVPVGKLADQAMDFIDRHAEEPSAIAVWNQRNVHGLREFWARAPSDALELKKRIEAAIKGLGA
jgi:phage recombination protein Bet